MKLYRVDREGGGAAWRARKDEALKLLREHNAAEINARAIAVEIPNRKDLVAEVLSNADANPDALRQIDGVRVEVLRVSGRWGSR